MHNAHYPMWRTPNPHSCKRRDTLFFYLSSPSFFLEPSLKTPVAPILACVGPEIVRRARVYDHISEMYLFTLSSSNSMPNPGSCGTLRKPSFKGGANDAS